MHFLIWLLIFVTYCFSSGVLSLVLENLPQFLWLSVLCFFILTQWCRDLGPDFGGLWWLLLPLWGGHVFTCDWFCGSWWQIWIIYCEFDVSFFFSGLWCMLVLALAEVCAPWVTLQSSRLRLFVWGCCHAAEWVWDLSNDSLVVLCNGVSVNNGSHYYLIKKWFTCTVVVKPQMNQPTLKFVSAWYNLTT